VISAVDLDAGEILLSGWAWERQNGVLCDGLYWRYACVDACNEPGCHHAAASWV